MRKVLNQQIDNRLRYAGSIYISLFILPVSLYVSGGISVGMRSLLGWFTSTDGFSLQLGDSARQPRSPSRWSMTTRRSIRRLSTGTHATSSRWPWQWKTGDGVRPGPIESSTTGVYRFKSWLLYHFAIDVIRVKKLRIYMNQVQENKNIYESTLTSISPHI